jgi:L-seryl-tRNA(Ser) seleniumtransferase
VTDPRRLIPSVDRLLSAPEFATLLAERPRPLVVEAVQSVLQGVRAALLAETAPARSLADAAWYAEATERALAQTLQPSLRRVINATGVVLHTNLGRAPLPDVAVEALTAAARGYSNLEYDLDRGARGSRYDHCARLLTRLGCAEAALVVNNNAAALVLALNTLARDREAVISRGELVEIGGSFRIPDIMARAGAHMVEVGATNRTHLDDYARALGDRTGVVVKVHPSNFRMSGFTADVSIAALAELAQPRAVPVLYDLGSGLLLAAGSLGLPYEPTPRDAIEAGADVVVMSGDKLLGGPQAGILLGRADLIERMRRNPLCRALRVDKLTLAALEATLALYLDPERARREVPVLRMLTCTADAIRGRAEGFVDALGRRGIRAALEPASSAVGGGAFPELELASWHVRIAVDDAGSVEERLRAHEPAVVARIVDGQLAIDPRTVDPAEEAILIEALVAVLCP